MCSKHTISKLKDKCNTLNFIFRTKPFYCQIIYSLYIFCKKYINSIFFIYARKICDKDSIKYIFVILLSYL